MDPDAIAFVCPNCACL